MSGTMQPMMKPMLTPQMASAASNLAAMGSGRDNMLAHINPREAQMLMRMGGKGNMNPRTGLPQFDDGGGGGGDVSQPVGQPVIPTGGTAPSGFTPSSVPYTDLGGAQADNPFDTALYSSYGGSGPVAPGTAPIDPALANFVDQNVQSFSTGAGGGAQDPFQMAFAPGAGAQYSQFAATPGNPNFSINPEGYADFTPAGQAAYGAYADQAQKSIAANAANNQSGIGGFLGTPEGALAILGLPLGIGALAELAGAVGVGASLGGFAGDAGAVGSDVFDLGAAGTSIVPDAALGTAADPFAVGSAVTSDFAGGLGDSFIGAEGIGDAALGGGGSAAAAADLGVGVPDATFGAISPASGVDDVFLGGTTSEAVDPATLAAGGDAWDLPGSAGSLGTDAAPGGGDLATLDTGQFPSGFIEPPDPATGLSPGAVGGTGGTGSGGGFFDKLLATGEKELSDPFKLLGLGASGFGLLNGMATQNKNIGNVGGNLNQLGALANQTGQTGTQLQSYLASGTLPPGLQSSVDTATASAIQNIKAKYAANGMGPNSTPEAQDIAKIQAAVPATIATIGTQLLQSGTADLQISQSTLEAMLTANTSLNNQTNSAIANLARALSGGTTTTTTRN